jgi:hypothetical protein
MGDSPSSRQAPKRPPKPSRPSLTPIEQALKSVEPVPQEPPGTRHSPWTGSEGTTGGKHMPATAVSGARKESPLLVAMRADASVRNVTHPSGTEAAQVSHSHDQENPDAHETVPTMPNPMKQQKTPTKYSTLPTRPEVETPPDSPSKPALVFTEPSDTAPALSGEIDLLYHKNHMSQTWLVFAMVLSISQFTILFIIGNDLMLDAQQGFNLFFVCGFILILILVRLLSKKRNALLRWTNSYVKSPDDEADDVPDYVIYMLAVAAIFQGVAYAVYSTVTAGFEQKELNVSGFYSSSSIVQTISFATITFYSMHRILRPANRLDPLRTVLEVCFHHLN